METHAAMARALPDDLLADVLARLPLRSLAVSQCICKAWRALTDEHRLLLPRWVRSLFIHYGDYRRPHFFARPAASPEDGPRIDRKSFVSSRDGGAVQRHGGDARVQPHHAAVGAPAAVPNRAFLVFDPAALLDYKVLLEPLEPKEDGVEEKDACRSTEWPPSPVGMDVARVLVEDRDVGGEGCSDKRMASACTARGIEC
uniref:F-box domain-containing protein n=1 Tax=Setaria italica TaxID=4555 RepID=K3ZNU5_SETIT